MSLTASLQLLAGRPAWRRLWAAEALSLVGDWFSLVAVSVVSLAAGGGGVVALAISLVAHLLPQALLSPVAGLFADRFDRKRILIGASLVEGALTLGMLASVALSNITLLQVLLFARASVSSFRPPASGAALPKLVAAEEIGAANALSAATWSVAFAMGMALGGLATEVSPLFALGIDAATFFGSSLLLMRLPKLPAREGETETSEPGVLKRALEELRRALKLGITPGLRENVFGKTPAAFGSGVGWIALNLVAQDRAWFGGGAATLGILQALRGIGTGIGPLIAVWLTSRGVNRGFAEHGAIASVVSGLLVLTAFDSPVFACLGVLLWGIGGGANWVLTTTRIQERAPGAFLGRLLALDALSFTVAMSVSAMVSALLVQHALTLGATVLVIVTSVLFVWLALRVSGARASAVASRL